MMTLNDEVLEKIYDETYHEILDDEHENKENPDYKVLSLEQKNDKAYQITMMKFLKTGMVSCQLLYLNRTTGFI